MSDYYESGEKEDRGESLLSRIAERFDREPSDGSSSCDINERDCHGETLLHSACREGDLRAARQLLERGGANVNAQNNFSWTPLHYAASNGYVEVVRVLLHHGADPDANATVRGRTPLHSACVHKQWEIVKLLIEHGGANVNGQNEHGRTPLHYACRWGTPEFVRWLLLDHGADVSIVDLCGKTPLHHACEQNERATPEMFRNLVQAHPSAVHLLPLRMLQRLVEHFPGALRATSSTEATGDLPIHEACRNGSDPKVILYMAEQDPGSVREINRAGRLPLHEACAAPRSASASVEVTQFLVRFYSEALSTADNLGRLPLHLASMGGGDGRNFVGVDVLEVLLRDNQSAIDTRDRDGKIPLVHACERDAPLDLVFLLLSKNPIKVFSLFSTL